MKNDIRQRSVLSPYLFNLYVNDLNTKLISSGVGCHIANKALNNFAYADDLALIAPSAPAMNELLRICDEFAIENYIKFNTSKSVAMLILPSGTSFTNTPNIYLSNC